MNLEKSDSSPHRMSTVRKLGLTIAIAAGIWAVLSRGDRGSRDFKESEDIIRHIQLVEHTPIGGPIHLEGIGDLFVTHETDKALFTLVGPLKQPNGQIRKEDVIWMTLLGEQFSLWPNSSPGPNYRIWWNETKWFLLSDSAQEIIVDALRKHNTKIITH